MKRLGRNVTSPDDKDGMKKIKEESSDNIKQEPGIQYVNDQYVSVDVPQMSELGSQLQRGYPSTSVKHEPNDPDRKANVGDVTGNVRREIIPRFVAPHILGKYSKRGQVESGDQPLLVSSNYFRVNAERAWCLYRHHVDFLPDEELRKTRKQLLWPHAEKFGGKYLYDGGNNLITLKPLTEKDAPIRLYSRKSLPEENGESKSTKVTIIVKFTGTVDKGDYAYIQVFNIIMRTCLAKMDLLEINRNYYDPKKKIDIPQFSLEIWPGYETSIRQQEESIMLCCKISHKVLRKKMAIEVWRECARANNGEARFKEAMIGSQVMTVYNDRFYRIDDVDFTKNPLSTFKKSNGEEVSFVNYLTERYERVRCDYRVTDMSQPLLVMIPTEREQKRRRGMDGPILLIPELCRLTGLGDDQRNNLALMRARDDKTRLRPSDLANRLIDFNHRLNNAQGVVEELHQWRVEVDRNLVTVKNARVLRSEMIYCGPQYRVQLQVNQNADFGSQLRNLRVVYQIELNNWVAVVPDRCSREFNNFLRDLQMVSNGMGFNVRPPIIKTLQNDSGNNYVETIEEGVRKSNPQMILTVLPNNRTDRYQAIKKKCIVDRSVPSQVMLQNLLNKGKNIKSIATKLAIQMNCKLGGAPWGVCIPEEMNGLMVIGYDTNKDLNKTKGRCYAAMVASLNDDLSRYYSHVSNQSQGAEMAAIFVENIGNAIRRWQEINAGKAYKLPTRIFIYRDGVGDGNLGYIHQEEIPTIKKFLEPLYKNNNQTIKLAYIVVNKRSNARFFLNNGSNPPPGTVIDDVVTDPMRYDFYLISQNVRQGTVCPTYYNVLIADPSLGMSSNEVQRFTYKLTHLYYNWSGTVKVPAPCQYAQKLAFLASNVIKVTHSNMNDLLYFL